MNRKVGITHLNGVVLVLGCHFILLH